MRTSLARFRLVALPAIAISCLAGATVAGATSTESTPDAVETVAPPATGLRWVHVDESGQIVAQSGGFTVVAGYPVLANTAAEGQPDNSLRANGNVYIDAGQDLSNSGLIATLTLQNTVDLDGGGMAGRTEGANANLEFAGEITVSVCNTGAPTDPPSGPTNCAPPEAQNGTSFVVSPRNSDGSVTAEAARKGFYVVIVNS